jgi:hypothetical protein
MFEPRLLMRLGAGVSIVGHMAVLVLGLLFADARPFDSLPSEAIAVDIVTPEQAKEQEKPAEPAKPAEQKQPERKQPDPIDFSALTAPIKPEAPTQQPNQQAALPKSQAATASQSRANSPAAPPQAAGAQPEAKSSGAEGFQPDLPQQQNSPQLPAVTASTTGPPTVAPDVTVKYGVMLGLPSASGPDGIEAPAIDAAKIGTDDISAFRRHLKTCSSLPPSVTPTDKVRIVLRVFLSREGKLVTEPALIEASASAKGPALMQKAMQALQACQPYAMLPPDKYKEWKVLDLAFTPQDFGGG